MNHREHKVQMTVRLAPETFKRAKAVERSTGTPISVVVAEAASEALAPEPFETPGTRADRLQQTVLNRINGFERTTMKELFLLREAIGILMRTYLNHTPAVPESERAAASLSGQVRMRQALKSVTRNTEMGVSIFDAPVPNREADDVA